MRKVLLFAALPALLFTASCGNQAEEDAEAFCNCVKEPNDDCEGDMEKLEEEFKKDKDRFETFAKAAKEKCPDAAKYIDRMK